MQRSISWMLFLFVVLSLVTVQQTQGQQVIIGQRVPADQRMRMDQIDHSSWDALLQKHVNQQGQVNYAAWHASPDDQRVLDQYINVLSSVSTTEPATRAGQLAFWINAYNAVTIKGILREYPAKSIRDHTSRLGGYNIWEHLQLAVADTQVSLEGIEHEVLRKMGEPRIHFAIVCASHSCPRLLNRAYTGPDLEEQLAATPNRSLPTRTTFSTTR